MSDTPSATTHELLRTAAVAVDSLPGVARLEPTLMNALRRLRIARTQEARPAAPTTYFSTDGIRLTRRGNVVDVHVDISVKTFQPASTTAQAVRETLLTTIAARQLTPGNITVNVLKLQA
jgi:hypothetical protein